MAGLIAHEWIASSGGSERVFFALATLYPDAALRVLWADATGPIDPKRLRQSWISRTPLRRSKALALPLMPYAWRQLTAPEAPEWLLVSTHLFAHHAIVKAYPRTPKLVYAHTPARYIWAPQHDSRGASVAARAGGMLLKPIDRERAQEAVAIATNSVFTQQRIRESWRRDAEVIYPPVNVTELQSVSSWTTHLGDADQELVERLPRGYLLGASRFVPYKRLDLAIRAGEATRRPVVLAGSGPDEKSLRALAADATVPIRIISSPSDALLRALYEHAAAYVFGAIEDFGIMPVEAMALGTPVVAPALGGASESVIDGLSGALFGTEADGALAEAVFRALECDRAATRQSVARFDSSEFANALRGWMNRNVDTAL